MKNEDTIYGRKLKYHSSYKNNRGHKPNIRGQMRRFRLQGQSSQCRKCRRTFRNRPQFYAHIKYCTIEICFDCKKRCRDKSDLRKHLSRFHGKTIARGQGRRRRFRNPRLRNF